MPARRVVPAETRSTCVQTLYQLLHKDTDTERGASRYRAEMAKKAVIAFFPFSPQRRLFLA